MHKLTHLLTAIQPIEIVGNTAIDIRGIVTNSRRVEQGSLFVAVVGTTVDAHRFIPDVVAAGASAVVCEKMPETVSPDVCYIRVSSSSEALGLLAAQWYGNPSRSLTLVGVTGTNGKTTIATLLYDMARLQGHKAGLLSTVANYVDDRCVPSTHTTPDPLTIQALMREMVDCGCTFAAMEVSSHACAQHRIAGLDFDGAIFTNLTRDHLDYHKTVQEYLKAKKSFFDHLKPEAWALVNIDDRNGEVMLQNCEARRYTYALRSMADFHCKVIENRLDGMLLDINGREVETLFTGRFNAYNLAAVYGAAVLTGVDPTEALILLSRLTPVAGRFQTFARAGVTAVVDYAHTPDALVNVLTTIRDVMGKKGNIITVTGAGGNRDAGKRPIMAHEAALRSGMLILTADNPRNEDPAAIIDDMRRGLAHDEETRTLAIADRREAIRTAVRIAKPGDVVLVAGKGHETYQEICGVRHHFDDREEVQKALECLAPDTNQI